MYCGLGIIKNRFIVKIGGVYQDKELCGIIELYDSINCTWQIIDPTVLEDNIDPDFNIYSQVGCVNISQDDIYVFGGVDGNGIK